MATSTIDIHHGMNTRAALMAAAALGCTIQKCRGSYHYRMRHPEAPHAIQIDHTRKDAPRHLTTYLLRLAQRRNALQQAAQRTLEHPPEFDDGPPLIATTGPAHPPRPRYGTRIETVPQPAPTPSNGDTAMRTHPKISKPEPRPALRHPAAEPDPRHPEPPKHVAKITLAGPKRFRLYDYLTRNRERIERERQTQNTVAAAASAELGFPVNRNHVHDVAQHLEPPLAWPTARPARASTAALEETMAELIDDVAALKAALADLAGYIGRPLHPDLRDRT